MNPKSPDGPPNKRHKKDGDRDGDCDGGGHAAHEVA